MSQIYKKELICNFWKDRHWNGRESRSSMSVVEVQSWWQESIKWALLKHLFQECHKFLFLLFIVFRFQLQSTFLVSIAIKLGLKFISVPKGCVIIVLSYEVAGTKLILVIIMIAILSIVIIILTSMHSYRYTLIPMRARIYHFNPLTPRSNMYFSLLSTIQFLC